MPRSEGKQQIGRRGEDLACAELERQGLKILDRNWRCPLGEIDIVAAEVTDAGTTWSSARSSAVAVSASGIRLRRSRTPRCAPCAGLPPDGPRADQRNLDQGRCHRRGAEAGRSRNWSMSRR